MVHKHSDTVVIVHSIVLSLPLIFLNQSISLSHLKSKLKNKSILIKAIALKINICFIPKMIFNLRTNIFNRIIIMF